MSNPANLPRTAGVIGADWYATHVAIRLQDFFFTFTPWQRRLWDAGTISALKELLEASRWRSEHVLSDGTVTWFSRELERVVGLDAGVGDRRIKKNVTDELATAVPYDSRHWRALEQLLPVLERDYLQRWTAAADGQAPPGAERLARAFAAQLLDRGYSLAHLHAWVTRHINGRSTLGDLLADAISLDTQPDREFEVLLPFEVMPRSEVAQAQQNWLPGPATKAWLEARGGQPPGRPAVRYAGAFSYTVSAKDPYGAAGIVAGIRDRLLARASYASGYAKIRASNATWIHPIGSPTNPNGVPFFDLRPEHRGTYVRSLVRENKVHDVGISSTTLDDALELAASLNNSSSRGPALASGWSALEALLFAPGDPQDAKDGRGVVVCDRAAALVACSWPRSELTPLTYAKTVPPASMTTTTLVGDLAGELDIQQGGPPTQQDATAMQNALGNATSNVDRCRVLLRAYASSQRLVLDGPSDIAGQERMLALAGAPQRTLDEVRGHIRHAFRRMYRLRNIVVHGGAANSGGLDVALRTTAPLVGAALDRIAHAQLVNNLPPLALAARAELHIRLVGTVGGPGLADLLE